MRKKIKIFFSIFVFLFAIFLFVQLQMKRGEIRVITDKNEYLKNEKIIARIENNSKNFCFSSCYPYYLEKKNENWKKYNYEKCKNLDIVENCIKKGETKIFEIEKIYAIPGIHRLAIPICLSCKTGNFFSFESEIFSNEFLIK